MSAVQPANDQLAEHYPFQAVGTEQELYPPVCLRSHWDPTAMLRMILPEEGQGKSIPLPMDFRPYVKVCKDYVTSGPAVPAPLPPADVVFPSGGEFYPPGRYSANIDKESVLEYLDRRLDRWCQKKEYVPPTTSDMYVPNSTVVRSGPPTSKMVQELAMPQAVLREGPYVCRSKDDRVNWEKSSRLFNNPTKQDRYGADRYWALPGGKIPITHGEAQPVKPTASAAAGHFIIPRPGGNGDSGERAFGGIRPVYERPLDSVTRVAGISAAGNQAPA